MKKKIQIFFENAELIIVKSKKMLIGIVLAIGAVVGSVYMVVDQHTETNEPIDEPETVVDSLVADSLVADSTK